MASTMAFKKYRLLLASRSPRRKEILESAGFEFETFSSNSSESFDENLTIAQNLRLIAKAKTDAALSRLSIRRKKGILVLAADTLVILGQQAFGKPRNRSDARQTLRLLAGKKHRVMTGFNLYCPDESRGVTRVITTVVGFRPVSDEEIEWYLDSGEPFDKAGSYAIQGLAQQFVNYVKGDLLNVVGLPLNEFKSELRKHHWNVRRKSKDYSRKS